MNDKSMDILKSLFCRYSNSEDYDGDIPEVIDEYERIKVWSKCFGIEECNELHELIAAHGSASEVQGFCYGFRYAVQIMNACGLKGGVAV